MAPFLRLPHCTTQVSALPQKKPGFGPMPPPAKCATTVLDLDDDLLRGVPPPPGLPSLVRAALSCTTFLRAVGRLPPSAAASGPSTRLLRRPLRPAPRLQARALLFPRPPQPP
ncbi:hypothetical protein ZWY2020_042157 [Hordeum vulgare]|nr:hypothetical protein ZWY2020_042157 [Hordeum vulgare]